MRSITLPILRGSLALACAAAFGLLPSIALAAKKIPLTDARYVGPVTVASQSGVEISATTYDPATQKWTSLTSAGGMLISVSGSVKQEFLFQPADQQALTDILRAELVRHGIVQAVATGEAQLLKVSLSFKEGKYEHYTNEYQLTLEMSLAETSGRSLSKTYHLNSNAKATRWQKLNTSVWKGKMQLVQVALDTVIPDIQTFLAAGP